MARRTRGKGEGSVYRRADGRWVGAVELPRGLDGRRRRSRVVRKRKADVLAALDELKRQAADGVIPDKSTTVAGILTFWLDDVATGQVSPSSLGEYRKRVNRLAPLLGHVRLARLTVPHCQAAAAELQRQYAPKTARITIETLRAALRWAVAAGMIPRNPAEHVMLARAPSAKIDDALTAAESRAVIDAATGHDLEVMIWLALTYGMRLGELIGLHRPDIDLDAGEIHIRKAKTAAGVRSLPLIDDADRLLRRQLQAGPKSDGPVFAKLGRPWAPQSVRTEWNTILAAAEVGHRCRNCGTDRPCSTSVRRFHASRHTAATLLLERGVALEVVSAILGHSSIGVTADVYARVRSDLKRRGLESIDRNQQ